MSGPFDEEPGTPPPSDSGSDQSTPQWPDEDLRGNLDPWGDGPWDVKRDGERRRPTSAEQAVPWLIGLVLALTGLVIVMTVLIFNTDGSATASASPSPSQSLAPTPEATTIPTPTPSLQPTATPIPSPEYGALELLYRGPRGGTTAVMVHDFSTSTTPEPALTDARGIDVFDWSPDGRWGAGVAEGALIIVEPGGSTREVVTGIDGLFLATDSTGVWALRVTHASSSTDKAELIRVDVPGDAVSVVATYTYPTPVTFQESVAREKAFADDGGNDRVIQLDDGRVAIIILGAPDIYSYAPATGATATLAAEPKMWAPNAHQWIEVRESGGTTTLILRNAGGTQMAAVSFTGLVSHVRWSPTSVQAVFTVTRETSGAPQDLFVWDLTDGKQPSRLTQDGGSAGPVWRGAPVVWLP